MESRGSLLESFIGSPITWGVVALVGMALALSGKLSMGAAKWILWLAFASAVFGIWRAEVILQLDVALRLLVVICCASGFAVGTLLLDRWLTSPKPAENSAVTVVEHPALTETPKENETLPAPKAEAPKKPPPKPNPVGKVLLALAIGDDAAQFAMITHPADKIGDLSTVFNCTAPFTCYSEEVLTSHRVIVEFGAKKWRRFFFLVANVAAIPIPHPTVSVSSQTNGVSVYRSDQRTTTPQISFQLSPTENIDILPYSKSDSAYGYIADVTVDDGVSDFDISFRVFSDNLKIRTLVAHVRASRLPVPPAVL
jgi:hypothetical protein